MPEPERIVPGGLMRRFHLEVLYRASLGDVARDLEFEYRVPGRVRKVTEAVYLLESCALVSLGRDGSVTPTASGLLWLLKRQTTLAEGGYLVAQPT